MLMFSKSKHSVSIVPLVLNSGSFLKVAQKLLWHILCLPTLSADGYQSSIKMKRSRAHQVKHKSTISLYNKLTDLVGNLAELVEIQELTDTLILQVLI